MFRATTPKHIFIFTVDPTLFSRILITYAQNGNIILEKTKDDLEVKEIYNSRTRNREWYAWFYLTQEETNLFNATKNKTIQLQIRILTTEGEALASEIYSIEVRNVLNDEVLI